MIEFIQHTLKCIIKHIDGCNNYELIIDSGKCTEKNNEFSFQTIAPSSFVIEKIRNDLFPFPRNNINILFDNLNILSEYACMNKYKFSLLLTHQIEHVNIIKSDNNGYCERSWNNIKLGLIAKNGKTLYKDFIIGNDIEETINKININFNLLLEDASYLEQEIRLPNGSSSVIFAKGTGGFLVHEILGHMVEGDLISRGMSIFGNRINIGDKIGADNLNVLDDPYGFNDYIGLNAFDDEGNILEKVNIVTNGVLSGYICNEKTAKQLNFKNTGCARRKSYKFKSMPRMRVTYILSNNVGGDCDSIISSVESGIYVDNICMGQVNPKNGDYLLYCGTGNIINKGKITDRITNFIIKDNIINTLNNIELIGNDFLLFLLYVLKKSKVCQFVQVHLQ
ncbi:TldD/PmbA family protein [Caldicellulosiruptoraceae bacterium PP1]